MRRISFRFRNASLGFGLVLLLFLLGVVSCEKDDICVDGDTPLLVIQFFDAEEPDTRKSVSQLRIIGLGKEAPVDTFDDRSTLDSISIPLLPEAAQTTFILIQESREEDGVETGNADTLRFTYDTTGEFISRACGFVAQYENLNSDLEPDSENWIKNIEVLNASVKKQDTTHVSIYH